ncbi:MAG TPA: cysteine hydrolase [Lacisediminihabitans sp.]|uniref:cysteine hydrolase family protein n=1 Tax=Lacisediminihabitans sp. TaxID=2787631 RepID=UPI002ED8E82D
MAITTLDPQTALIVIDLQNGILASPKAHPLEGVLGNAIALTDAFRDHGLPVVLVTVAGGAPGRTDQAGGAAPRQFPEGWADLIPELDGHPGDHLVTKRTWGAFHETGLNDHLQQLGVTQVVIVGVATSAGVESTARSAHEHGFNVTLPVDAMTDSSLEAHVNSVTRIFPRLAETGTTAELLDLLGK